MLKRTIMPGLFLLPCFGHAAVEHTKDIEIRDMDKVVTEEAEGRTDSAKQEPSKKTAEDLDDAVETTRHRQRFGSGILQ